MGCAYGLWVAGVGAGDLDFDLDPKRASLEESSSPSPLFKLNLPILVDLQSIVIVKGLN